MIQDRKNDKQIDYTSLGINKMMTKDDAPIFQTQPVTYKEARLGTPIVNAPSNVEPGTIMRGALAEKAKASPFIMHLSSATIYQVSSPVTKLANNLLVSIGGDTNDNYLDGWTLYSQFPLRDRTAAYNSTYNPSGIAVDADYVWFGAGAHLYRMPLDFSSVTEITGGGIPAINGLASDGKYLYTTNGTAFYKITVSGDTYTYETLATLGFTIDKLACYNGRRFIGYDSGSGLLREFNMDGSLWRDIPYSEPTFLGILTMNGFSYVVTQLGASADVQAIPLII